MSLPRFARVHRVGRWMWIATDREPRTRGEDKTARVGTLAVEVEKMKSELFEAEMSLLADKELAFKLIGSCATQASEWEEC